MPARRLRVMLAQYNLIVGDIAGNAARVVEGMESARRSGVDLLVFPEMTLCGYPAEDLLLRPDFIAANEAALQDLAGQSYGLTAIVGFAQHRGDELFNSAGVLHAGRLADVYNKTYLPNYGVFDEARYFGEGNRFPVLDRDGVKLGVNICEDIWYAAGPPQIQALAGAEILVNLSASPYALGKPDYREKMLATRAGDTGAYLVFCNLVGGQDELVFDGNSMVLDPDGQIIARGCSMAEDEIIVDLWPDEVLRDRLLDPRIRKARLLNVEDAQTPTVELESLLQKGAAGKVYPVLDLDAATRSKLDGPIVIGADEVSRDKGRDSRDLELGEVYAGLLLGTRDYVRKNGFSTVVLGLSGGIDSALTAAIAVDALGAENVKGVAMPARYSSPSSLKDAQDLAEFTGLSLVEIEIDAIFQAYLDTLEPHFDGRPADVAEENLQSRIRGNMVMALSNKFGWLPLTTGNKSEMSVGYATLYGDMAGGFAPLKDVLKTLVFDLSRWRNAQQAEGQDFIPTHSITRPPSAELRPDQMDSDSLPEYEVLDEILRCYVEREISIDEIVAQGLERETVERVATLVDRAEFKRRQSPPGVKITGRAFGRERRMPITKRMG